jgi:hypothetical protein
MRLAIVGGGVSGLYTAWHLSARHEVTLFEADARLGGHADTQIVDDRDRERPVDTGFIVYNEQHYPLFTAWLAELGVNGEPSDMSFGVRDVDADLEYKASTLNDLFCQRRNLLRPRFWGMVRDIVRFYRRAPELLETLDEQVTLGDWLESSGYGELFARRHMLPMASALWSAPTGAVSDFPMKHLLAFMDNHSMLTLGKRPPWKTLTGGSRRYVEAVRRCKARFETATPVRSVERTDSGVRLATDSDEAGFDAVVLACHSDQALDLLADASPVERSVLGAVGYQDNDMMLHTDVSVLPRSPRARAAWNVLVDGREADQCRVSYYMNRLQNIDSSQHFIVSLNQSDRVDPGQVLVRKTYAHPVFTPEAVAAQGRWRDINGLRRTWFAGAWWGWGFHEDGARSARRVIDDVQSRHG